MDGTGNKMGEGSNKERLEQPLVALRRAEGVLRVVVWRAKDVIDDLAINRKRFPHNE